MGTEMWAAIVGSLVLVVCGGVGTLFWTHMTKSQEDAENAHTKAHNLEMKVLQQQAEHTEAMRKAERQILEHQLEVANNYVKKSDHDGVVAEIFRKLDNQDRQNANGFASLRTWLDAKFDKVAQDLHGKQDRRST
jgi:hypothetical protein